MTDHRDAMMMELLQPMISGDSKTLRQARVAVRNALLNERIDATRHLSNHGKR